MWAKVASRFKGRSEVVGFNLINEPFAGDMYKDPLLMVPYPSPTNGDRVNLQPAYDKVNTAVRKIDEEVLLFIAGMTWGDFGSGFTAAPGGAAYSNRTVLTYHFYEPPQFTAAEQVDSHIFEAQRLGTAAMMTETEAPSGNFHDKKGNITDACDEKLQGWADWEWKSFHRSYDEEEGKK
jgi:endoglycosylceramidase